METLSASATVHTYYLLLGDTFLLAIIVLLLGLIYLRLGQKR